MKRVLIFDPSLVDECSHHYYAASAYAAELTQMGMNGAIVCHEAAGPKIKALGASAYFQVGGYVASANRSRQAEFESTGICNGVLHRQLVQLRQLELGPEDFVFFPAITSNQILGVCQWIAGFEPSTAPHFGLCLMFQPEWHPSGDVSKAGPDYYRQGFGFLPDNLRDRIVFTCETEGLAKEYAAMAGSMPLVLPMPTLQHLVKPREAKEEGITLSFMGYAKAEKGFHLLPEVTRLIRERRPDVHFVVQLLGHDTELMTKVRAELSEQDDSIEFIDGPIAPDAMVEIMGRTQLMLLPYDSATYRTRGSAIFTECKLTGVPMLLPHGTAIGTEGEAKGLAALFSHAEPAPIANAALGALERLDALEAAARRESESVIQAQEGYLAPLIRAVEASSTSRQATPQTERITA